VETLLNPPFLQGSPTEKNSSSGKLPAQNPGKPWALPPSWNHHRGKKFWRQNPGRPYNPHLGLLNPTILKIPPGPPKRVTTPNLQLYKPPSKPLCHHNLEMCAKNRTITQKASSLTNVPFYQLLLQSPQPLCKPLPKGQPLAYLLH